MFLDWFNERNTMQTIGKTSGVNQKTKLAVLFKTRPSVLTPLYLKGLRTLEQCAKAGTEGILSIHGVGYATLRTLQKECVGLGISWRKANFEKSADFDSPSYKSWVESLIAKRTK